MQDSTEEVLGGGGGDGPMLAGQQSIFGEQRMPKTQFRTVPGDQMLAVLPGGDTQVISRDSQRQDLKGVVLDPKGPGDLGDEESPLPQLSAMSMAAELSTRMVPNMNVKQNPRIKRLHKHQEKASLGIRGMSHMWEGRGIAKAAISKDRANEGLMRFCEKGWFRGAVALIIVLNAVLVGIEMDRLCVYIYIYIYIYICIYICIYIYIYRERER